MAQGMIMRRGGAAASGLPEFTYTGTYTLLDDGDKNWRIRFLTSGSFTPARDIAADIFLVGGGGSGARRSTYAMGGGGGGYTATHSSVVLQAGESYSVVIGAGGASVSSGETPGKDGGSTHFHEYGVSGGKGPTTAGGAGGAGGSGGGTDGSAGGSNGGNGGGTYGGKGQGTTTREFGESSGPLYAGGGGGANNVGGAGGGGNGGSAGAINTGGGGGGAPAGGTSGTGGSGIVVIRNHLV